MAFLYEPSMFTNNSVEELEKELNEAIESNSYNSKEEQIESTIKNHSLIIIKQNERKRINTIIEALKEKTGKDYVYNPKQYDITALDMINYIANPETDSDLNKTLTDFFDKIPEDDMKKRIILDSLAIDQDFLNEFIKEISQTQNPKETFDKYIKLGFKVYGQGLYK